MGLVGQQQGTAGPQRSRTDELPRLASFDDDEDAADPRAPPSKPHSGWPSSGPATARPHYVHKQADAYRARSVNLRATHRQRVARRTDITMHCSSSSSVGGGGSRLGAC